MKITEDLSPLTEYGAACITKSASYGIFDKEYPIFSSKNISIDKTDRLILIKNQRSQFSSSYSVLSGKDPTTIVLIEIYLGCILCIKYINKTHLIWESFYQYSCFLKQYS